MSDIMFENKDYGSYVDYMLPIESFMSMGARDSNRINSTLGKHLTPIYIYAQI